MKVIIGTGWWSSNVDDRKIKHGDDLIRSKEFSEVWLQELNKTVKYDKLVVVDSNSPVKSQSLLGNRDFEYIELLENGGHATNIVGLHCGWSRGVILSMLYAYYSSCDYYVYIEQDVLIKGDNFVENIISAQKTGYSFGKSKDYPQPLQQSLFVIEKRKIIEFISRYTSIKYDDNEISCEVKFALCTSKFFKLLPMRLFVKKCGKGKVSKVINYAQRKISLMVSNFDYINVHGGRDRPIDFNADYYYFQHGSKEELAEHLK
ncbi:hypothetical protein J5X89_18890 [Vibrio sp. G41H]|uniref:hypothetical protein n=1 Tax=unclassified Vibrio TaxID=2614977 RepID=UPI001AD6AAB8|nr:MULTISPECIES: hypothetical protein [unclassified Vibrio]MBO7913687.1 hypothetical protein [Vibrio sp. G41H]MCF7492622.1 hypothetical protein [Vibrio sp. G-C-1]